MTVSTSPATAGLSISLSVQELLNSGGHFHLGRPLGSLAASLGTTDSQGKFSTTYTASLFGGGEIIRATSGLATGFATLSVQVPGLVELTTSSASYSLVGSTTTHPGNHFAKQNVINSLIAVADQYFVEVGQQLLFNDMSLVWGGLFDIGSVPSCPTCPFWAPPHNFHRTGRNCDINPFPLNNETRFIELVNGEGGNVIRDCDAGCNYHTTF